MKKNVLINCSNLHAGGGVAVATSFIDCLSILEHGSVKYSLLLSTEVNANLNALDVDLSVFENIKVIDFHGLKSLWGRLDKFFFGYDLVFTVFGPAYFIKNNAKHLFGFAQPNIIYPNNLYSSKLPLFIQLKTRVKFKLQELFYSRAHSFVVELEHVKRGLDKIFLLRDKEKFVVSSSVHHIFKNKNEWSEVLLPKSEAPIKLGVISKNYPHKNLKILPLVKDVLLNKYDFPVDFFVTFNDAEWHQCDLSFKEKIINVGNLDLNECPSFYSSLDGVVFPTLLECFSAVPIESMMLKKPLFASDLPFISDVCDVHCNYFDPLDELDIAKSIYDYFMLSSSARNNFVMTAYNYVQKYPSSHERAVEYIKVITSMLYKK